MKKRVIKKSIVRRFKKTMAAVGVLGFLIVLGGAGALDGGVPLAEAAKAMAGGMAMVLVGFAANYRSITQ